MMKSCRHRHTAVRSIVTFIILMISVASADAFIMVDDGFPACIIVHRQYAPKAEQFAARELASYLEKMTGAVIPVRTTELEDISPNSRVVLVGQGDWLALPRFSTSADDLEIQGADSFVLRTYSDEAPEVLIVAGGSTRSTVYAAYDLLGRLGVRWFTPAITHIPNRLTVRQSNLDVADFPCFSIREIQSGVTDIPDEWAAHLRLNAHRGLLERELDCDPVWVPRTISLNDFAPADSTVSGVDALPLVDGVRTARTGSWCYTSDASLSAIADNIERRLAIDSTFTHVILIPDTTGVLCTCEDCQKAIEGEGSKETLMLRWMERVAESIDDMPFDTTVVLSVPFSCTDALNRVDIPEHRVLLTGDEPLIRNRPFSESLDERVVSYGQILGEWTALYDNVTIRHAVGHYKYPALPFPDMVQTIDTILLYRNEYISGMIPSNPAGQGVLVADDELKTWVYARLMWDSDRDGAMLTREWIKGVYGYAWGPMFDYWKHLQKIALAPYIPLTVHIDPIEYITVEWLNTADRMIQRAYAQSMTDSTAHRYVRKTRLSVSFARLLLVKTHLEKGIEKKGVRYTAVSTLLDRWEAEMAEFGYNRVSSDETVAFFTRSLRELLDSRK